MVPEFEVAFTAHAYGGEAFGRLPDGRAVFAPFAIPGEKARVRMVEERKGLVQTELVEVLTPAPERISPPCIHYMQCGGCHYQHLDYTAQLTAKQAILKDQLERIGKLRDVEAAPTVPSAQIFNYRNYVHFHLTPQGELGFQKRRSSETFPLQECCLPEGFLNDLWKRLDIAPVAGLERVSLRLSAGDDVQLILESQDPQPPELLVEELPVSAVHLSPQGCIVLAGSPAIQMEVLGRAFTVSAGSFFQVNTLMAEALVLHILNRLSLPPGAIVLDVYCGVGLFSAFLAPHVGRLIGVESSASACEDFEANLAECGHVELYEAPAEDVLTWLDVRPDFILIDPPRAGLSRRALDGVLKLQAPLLTYVSCDPATLARDAARLAAGGYRLREVTPLDFFPQTYHIESVSFWELSKSRWS